MKSAVVKLQLLVYSLPGRESINKLRESINKLTIAFWKNPQYRIYPQDSTVKVGAPCQMASFATADFPHFSQKPPLDPLKPRRGGRGAGDIAVIHEDAIDRASDLERLETQSKISGVSSVYSSKSGGGGGKKKRRRRQKRPNPVSVRLTLFPLGEGSLCTVCPSFAFEFCDNAIIFNPVLPKSPIIEVKLKLN